MGTSLLRMDFLRQRGREFSTNVSISLTGLVDENFFEIFSRSNMQYGATVAAFTNSECWLDMIAQMDYLQVENFSFNFLFNGFSFL